MAKFEIVMPKMGESITEATITKWLKEEGSGVKEDDPIVEIATDKVDSEIPSPVEGVIIKLLYKEGDVVEVGKTIAIIGIDGETIDEDKNSVSNHTQEDKHVELKQEEQLNSTKNEVAGISQNRFYSPLVKTIAKKENISPAELEGIKGSGKKGRVTKNDVLSFLEKRSTNEIDINTPQESKKIENDNLLSGGDKIIEMDRVRQLIAGHMISSVHTSAHVTSFAEADMTNIFKFRESQKMLFDKNENEKLTFTHIIIHAVAKALKDFPIINASVDNKNIILKKDINIGFAVALPSGNLIVPVIKNADQKNLLGIVKTTNDLSNRARSNKLLPEEIQEGTFTVTNLGSFNTLAGTPIINQPQVAILSVGLIKKRPVVIETEEGDAIAIRHMMYVGNTYDHRVIDGAVGGMFLDKVVHYLENYDGIFS